VPKKKVTVVLVIVVGAMTRVADRPRSRRILRLIALERIARGVLLLATGVYLLFHLNSDFGRVAERVMRAIELDPRRTSLHRIVAYLRHLPASELRIAARPLEPTATGERLGELSR
jgi:hypothetical protein